MVKGTRIMMDDEAKKYIQLIENYRTILKAFGYSEIILPAMWDQQTFIDKAGPEIVNQMYAFNDKGDRPICLIPEATAIMEQLYKEHWEKSRPKPVRLFYVAKCYRYERPQAGRYREFTQFGVECMGDKSGEDAEEVRTILKACMQASMVENEFKDAIKRGLDYYVEDGFEVECPVLGAQKQVAGGGRYATGIGFAIGVDRVLLAKSIK